MGDLLEHKPLVGLLRRPPRHCHLEVQNIPGLPPRAWATGGGEGLSCKNGGNVLVTKKRKKNNIHDNVANSVVFVLDDFSRVSSSSSGGPRHEQEAWGKWVSK